MSNPIEKDQRMWVIVQNDGGEEQIVGLHDDQADVSFIPAFLTKEEALECFINLPRTKGCKYEAQSVIAEELLRDCLAGGFMLYLLNGAGEVSRKISPQP